MNGKYTATRTVQLAQMLIKLSGQYSDTEPADAAGKAAMAGAAEEITAMKTAYTDATAYGTAVKSVLTAMANQLDTLST